MRRFFLLIILLMTILIPTFLVKADELEDITKSLENLKKDLAGKEADYQQLNIRLNNIKAQAAQVEAEIVKKEGEVKKGEEALDYQNNLLNERVNSYYKNSGKAPYNLMTVLFSGNLSDSLRDFFYQQSIVDRDKDTIIKVVMYIKNLEEIKKNLETERSQLAALNIEIDAQSKILAGQISNTKTQIAELSAKQQAIINARSGGFTANVGDSDLADDYNASIKGFRESAPSGYFAAFSFGAYTHRKGMSQYGARARASSQNYKQILSAYYGKEPVNKDTGGSIRVEGNGEMDFETTYLYGIAEMPSSWPMEALKAQAIAARTYALRYKNEGKEICASQSCQVFLKSKSDSVPENWKKAVDETKGEVLEDVVTFYSSTAGGYLTTKGWDTTDGGGGTNFIDKSYEKLAGSPWIYKSWYTEGYSINSDKCGRSNPWLSPQEMADVINATMVMHRSGSGADTSRVTSISSCWGGNPYSMDELKNVSGSYGGGVGNVTGVVVSLGDGVTKEVIFQTDKGEKRLSGEEFKKGFNLRAPGRLSIPQKGFAFFNIERK